MTRVECVLLSLSTRVARVPGSTIVVGRPIIVAVVVTSVTVGVCDMILCKKGGAGIVLSMDDDHTSDKSRNNRSYRHLQ